MSTTAKAQVSVSPQAAGDVRRLGHGASDALGGFVRRLRADRANPALRLTPLRTVGDNGDLCTATADGRHMVLLLRTEDDRFSVLALRRGQHAYEDLARLTVEVNAVSGGVEVVDQTETGTVVVALPERPARPRAPQEPADVPTAAARSLPVPLFARHDDATLLGLGVIAPLLPAVRRIVSPEQLEALLGQNIPDLSRDVLLALHEGMEPGDVHRHITEQWQADDPVDPRDLARAARRPVSRVSTEDAAVLDALGDTFQAWRLFLHPSQQRLATADFKGSAKVTGGPGTGKTVVALHRVHHLVRRLPPGHSRPVLLTTYTTNLAQDLRERLDQLGGADLLRRVDVRSIDRIALEAVQQQPGIDLGRPIDDATALDLWGSVCVEAGEYGLDPEFLDAEFKHVIVAQGCGTATQYLRAERKGRGPLQRTQRVRIWELTELYRARLAEHPRQVTWAEIADRAARVEEERMSRVEAQARHKAEQGGRDLVHREAGSGMWLRPRYRHIVVDEAQDLSASHWRMLRAMVAPGPDDIFLVGDAHQRIYAHQVVLGRFDIRTPGRASRRLTLNYRTTRQILGSARGLITGMTFDDLDEGTDTLDGYRSVLSGLQPQYHSAPDWETEMRTIAALVQERHDHHGTPYSAMAVSVPDGTAATQLAVTLSREPFGIPATPLGKDGPGTFEGVRIGTMHRFKGLEFQRVILAGVSEGQVPRQRIEAFRDTDPRRYDRELRRARSLLFVAATRARDELIVTWSGKPSRFLPGEAVRMAGGSPLSASSAA